MEKASPCLHWLCAVSDVWKPLRMLNNFRRQVYIKLRPIEVPRRMLLNIHDCTDSLLLEPRKIIVRHEKLTVVREKPHTMCRDICHLNC